MIYTCDIASVAERSIATGCKPVDFKSTKVRILPGAQRYICTIVTNNKRLYW